MARFRAVPSEAALVEEATSGEAPFLAGLVFQGGEWAQLAEHVHYVVGGTITQES